MQLQKGLSLGFTPLPHQGPWNHILRTADRQKGFFFFFFWPHRMACGILVPQPGIEPGTMAVKMLSPNHWTTRKFPRKALKWMFWSSLSGDDSWQCKNKAALIGRGKKKVQRAEILSLGAFVQLILVIHKFCLCKFAYLLKLFCNPLINIWCRSVKNLSCLMHLFPAEKSIQMEVLINLSDNSSGSRRNTLSCLDRFSKPSACLYNSIKPPGLPPSRACGPS